MRPHGAPVGVEVTPAERFEQFLEFAPDGIVGVGADGRIELADAQTQGLFVYAREELLGEPVELSVPKRFHEAHPGHRTGYFADSRTRAKLELFGRRKDGSEFPAEISLSSIALDGRVLAIAAIRDISECRAREHELERSRRGDVHYALFELIEKLFTAKTLLTRVRAALDAPAARV